MFLAKQRALRSFLVVWLGQLVSVIGSGLTAFALSVWVYQQTGSVTQLALVFFFKVVPLLALSPVAGVLVDRWDRRKAMILGDTGAALATLALALLFGLGAARIWHIYALVAAAAVFEAFQVPAYLAAVTGLVPERHYARAGGMLQVAQAAADILAPLLAGALMVALRLWGILLIDLATFLFAVGALLLVRFPAPAARQEGRPGLRAFGEELVDGLRYVAGRPGLAALLLFFAGVYFLGGLITALVEPLLLAFATPDVLGAVLSVAGGGLLAGGLVLSAWGGPRRRVDGILAFAMLLGLCLAGMGLKPWAPLIALCAFGAHFSMPFINGLNQAIWQGAVDPGLQGRAFAIRQMVSRAAQPLAFLVAGPLADRLLEPFLASGGALAEGVSGLIGPGPGRGPGLAFVLIGLLVVLLGAAARLWPGLRRLDSRDNR